MNTNDLIWKNFYKEFASKLLAYKDDRKRLLSKLSEVYKRLGKKLPKLEKDNSVIDVDPFTVFAFFNRTQIDDYRVNLLEELAKEFQVDSQVPETFDDIPFLSAQSATFLQTIRIAKKTP